MQRDELDLEPIETAGYVGVSCVTGTFSGSVPVKEAPAVMLQVGNVIKPAGHQGGSGTAALTLRYPVADGDEDTDGLSVPVGRHPQRGDDHVALLMIHRTSWGRCVARPEGLFTGVAVELDAGNRIFTTLPVLPVQK